jgi:glucosyl-3-phosphoglycerate phosphatase
LPRDASRVLPKPLSLPEILVLRHGETEWNREGRMQGGCDSPLTPLGQAQSMAMGRLLARQGVTSLTHDVLSSPQGRAVATAEIIHAQLGRTVAVQSPVRIEPRLREIAMGQWSGLTRAEITLRWPGAADESLLDFYARAPGAERFEALWTRAASVLADLTRPTVIITHGMTSRFLRTAAMGLDMSALATLPGGQGCVHRICGGLHDTLVADVLHVGAAQATSTS